jgi:hypothetical protein
VNEVAREVDGWGFGDVARARLPGIDAGWAFLWTEKTFNFKNDVTDYQSGDEFHFEWAIGYELCEGLLIGVVGYDWRQLTGDSGRGAALIGPFKGQVDAVVQA